MSEGIKKNKIEFRKNTKNTTDRTKGLSEILKRNYRNHNPWVYKVRYLKKKNETEYFDWKVYLAALDELNGMRLYIRKIEVKA